MKLARPRLACLATLSLVAGACGGEPEPSPTRLTLLGEGARVEIGLAPFTLEIADGEGRPVLATLPGGGDDPYGALAATVDAPIYTTQPLPGWDGYLAQEAPWRHATRARVVARESDSVTLALSGEGVNASLVVALDGARVRLRARASEAREPGADDPLNKTTLSFASGDDEHFFGMGERFATVDHRGWQLYSWAEEGALGRGEDAAPSEQNPFPSGPSMTYFPVPFFLSSRGYGVHLDTTYRTEVNFAAERGDAWRFAVNASSFDAVVYAHRDPLATLDDYTLDTGRAMVPAPWNFGLSRRSNADTLVNGVPEWQAMRDADIACTSIDDSVHFLPASSQTGREAELRAWTKTLHDAGYRAIAYNNPYVAEDDPRAAADYAFGKEHGYFVKGPDGEPTLTQFISGKMLTVAAVDLTNPGAVTWYQSLLRRTLDLGYDGWMHDFGEYTPRDAVFFDGRRGDELHDLYPVLSAKAAHELLERERPGDYLFFVRSGYAGTQQYAPMVWQGDAEATFDETLGLPSAVRAGVNLSMSGAPFWGSDMTGFKCLTGAPTDKEVFIRWVEFGAVSPFMHEENACSNPLGGGRTKWNLWGDAETTDVYRKYARLHTRLQPYFMALAELAHATGRPLTLHPFLLFPEAPETWAIEDAYFLGPALYAWPVVRRGQTEKSGWIPPGRYLDLDDFTVLEGGREVSVPAPLGKLPLFLVANQLLPMLDPAIDTLAPASDPDLVTPDRVADRLDVMIALAPGGHASFTLADGTELVAERLASDAGNPGGLTEAGESELPDCASCFHVGAAGALPRLRVNGAYGSGSELTLRDVRLTAKGGAMRRVRWDVIALP